MIRQRYDKANLEILFRTLSLLSATTLLLNFMQGLNCVIGDRDMVR